MTASPKKVAVAISGGVDSAVACVTLKHAGHDVTAVFMRLTDTDDATLKGNLDDVRQITSQLDVPLEVVDFSREIRCVISYFIDEYAEGRTPNPCVRCNQMLKFGALLDFAADIGASALATGHYARMVESAGEMRIARACAVKKDQSYVLHRIDRARLPSLMFPNGEFTGKDEIRRAAESLNLSVHDKQDSQEICFVPDDDYVRFVLNHRPELNRPGDIIDIDGKVLGRHEGVFRYTIGQRRGLRVAAGYPIYVVKIDLSSNTVVLGPREALLKSELIADDLNWHEDPPTTTARLDAKIRYAHQAAPVIVHPLEGNSVKVVFDTPQNAVTPGQAAVFYRDDIVVGGGWIRGDDSA